MANPASFWSALLAVIVFGSLVALFFVVLTPHGLGTAIARAVGLCLVGAALYYARSQGWLASATPWITGAFALIMVFALANHILTMAIQALKRGILNQHVLLEIGAFAGIAGGIIGLALQPVDYPTASFFAVSVMVVTYHVFSEWLSLIVKTRSSQAVKKLLDLQPRTARVVRGAGEAAERGILMRTGEAFQAYRLVRYVVLDKTGTLTEGQPLVQEVLSLGASEEKLPGIAAAAEASSEHPLAQAIVNIAFAREVTPVEVTDFAAVPGRGVKARIEGPLFWLEVPSF